MSGQVCTTLYRELTTSGKAPNFNKLSEAQKRFAQIPKSLCVLKCFYEWQKENAAPSKRLQTFWWNSSLKSVGHFWHTPIALMGAVRLPFQTFESNVQTFESKVPAYT